MRRQILNLYAMTLDTAERLVADIPCERFAELPYPDAKHPAWVLGHLALGGGMMLAYLRGESEGFGGVPEAWAPVCMPGAALRDERTAYASKDELLAELRRIHSELAEAFSNASDELLASPFPNEAYRSFFPTNADAAVYLMAHHEGYHLGQLSQWRRAAGFGPLGDPE
tara:strand:- start:153 stop:659 length:507 start_codon:yes stop_codon:yes gene_type:complete